MVHRRRHGRFGASGVKAPLASVADFDKTLAELDAKIEGIKKDLKLE